MPWPQWSLVAVIFGLLLRLSRYVFDATLFNDEAVIVVDNLLKRDFADLFAPLVKDQVAPPGFLAGVKLSSLLFGVSEYAFRLVPLLAALASMVLFYHLARRILDARSAALSVVLFAVCWNLANYGHFTKQYASDVAIAAGILLCAVRQSRESAREPKRLFRWAVWGSIAVWFSHPAVFVLAGVGAAWVVREWMSERRLFRAHAIVSAAWAASFVTEYWLTLRQATKNSYLVHGWDEAFLPLPPRSLSDWLWIPRTLADVFASIDGTPAGGYLAVVSLGMSVLGAMWFFRVDRFALTLLTVPIIAAMAASAMKKYPFSHRLVFFLYPMFILLLCAGLGRALRRIPQRPYAAALLAALVLGPPLAKAAYGLATQPATQDIKPLMRLIDEQHRQGDLVWVEPLAGPSFFYYREYLHLYADYPSSSICWNDCHGRSSDPAASEEALEKAAHSRRVWVLATYAGSAEVEAERKLLEQFDTAGARIGRFERRGCALTLYEMRHHGRVYGP